MSKIEVWDLETADKILVDLVQRTETGFVLENEFRDVSQNLLASLRDYDRRLKAAEAKLQEVRQRQSKEPELGCSYCDLVLICGTFNKDMRNNMCKTCYDTYKAKHGIQ